MTKVSFDINGVIFDYPDIWRPIFRALCESSEIEVHVVSDQKKENTVPHLYSNSFYLPESNVHYIPNRNSKSSLMRELGIDIDMDSLPGYPSEDD